MSIQTNVWYYLFCQGFCTVPEQTSNTTNLYNTLHTKTNAHTKRPLLNVVEDCIQNFIYYFIRIFCDFAGYFLDYLQYVILGFSACTMYILPYFLIHMCMWSNVCYCLRYTAKRSKHMFQFSMSLEEFFWTIYIHFSVEAIMKTHFEF